MSVSACGDKACGACKCQVTMFYSTPSSYAYNDIAHVFVIHRCIWS